MSTTIILHAYRFHWICFILSYSNSTEFLLDSHMKCVPLIYHKNYGVEKCVSSMEWSVPFIRNYEVAFHMKWVPFHGWSWEQEAPWGSCPFSGRPLSSYLPWTLTKPPSWRESAKMASTGGLIPFPWRFVALVLFFSHSD